MRSSPIPCLGKAAMQYGTTEGYARCTKRSWSHHLGLERQIAGESRACSPAMSWSAPVRSSFSILHRRDAARSGRHRDRGGSEHTSSITAPSPASASRVLQVSMDDPRHTNTDALAETSGAARREKATMPRVKMIYVIDYFQNPSGPDACRSNVARSWSNWPASTASIGRSYILEDAAYRELATTATICRASSGFDTENRHVMLTMTFSQADGTGLQDGLRRFLPRDLVQPLLRFPGRTTTSARAT